MSIAHPKSVWSGSLSIGLVNVPIKLAGMVTGERISFNRVCQMPDGTIERLRQVQLNSEGKEVPSSDWLKGYPVGEDYLIVTPEELESCEAVQTKSIEIDRFVLERSIDPILYDKPYVVFPDKGGEKGYALMVRAMKKQKVAAVGRFVLRSKQYIVSVRPRDNMLLAHLLFYPADVVELTPWDQGLGSVSVSSSEVSLASKLVEQMTDVFDPSRYRNEVADAIRNMLEQKMRGEGVKVRAQETVKASDDLLSAIEASLDEQQKRPAKATTNGKAHTAAKTAARARSKKAVK